MTVITLGLASMLTMKARVRNGRLRLDEPYEAPEGTEVDVAIIDDGDELDDESRARLHAALSHGHEQMVRREVVPADEVLSKLGTRG
ncbi:MAG: hypothetical protein HS104_03185 [Polyangiaceae bacterium]|nr:hypothetical protein [Polyangiaceae bacterium]MCL4756683.1 hypothetical protein [Myxococcales bacterium]